MIGLPAMSCNIKINLLFTDLWYVWNWLIISGNIWFHHEDKINQLDMFDFTKYAWNQQQLS